MEVKWYCRGGVGEYILDQVEAVINGSIRRSEFWWDMHTLGLSADEIKQVMIDFEIISQGLYNVEV